jgi:hypothetical protein
MCNIWTDMFIYGFICFHFIVTEPGDQQLFTCLFVSVHVPLFTCQLCVYTKRGAGQQKNAAELMGGHFYTGAAATE